jgi:hypothetical protein
MTVLVARRCGTVHGGITTATQWSHSHATDTGASRRQLSEGRDDERNQEGKRGEETALAAHAQEL